MKFLANENIEKRIITFLRNAGHDVSYCAEIRPRLDDDAVLHIANREHRIIITNDKDFGELTYLQHKTKTGILLLRFQIEDTEYKIDTIKKVLKEYADKIPRHFIVVSEDKLRIRPIFVQ
jgi:predicted nuclease of predicted toxin-antitoxin system